MTNKNPTVSAMNTDGSYDVSYVVVVENVGGAAGQYDLSDTPNFEDDITINNASFTSNTGLSGGLSTVNNTANILADDQAIAVGMIDSFFVSFNVTLDLSAASVDGGDNVYTACESGTTGGFRQEAKVYIIVRH